MKNTFSIRAGSNGGVIVTVRASYAAPDPIQQIRTTVQELKRDELINPVEDTPVDPDNTGEYIFTWYNQDGKKQNPMQQALDFIEILVEEYGLATQDGYGIR